MCVHPLYPNGLKQFQSKISLLWPFNIAGKINTYLDIHVNCLISIKFEITLHIFIEVPNIKFHFNRPSGSRVDPCGQTDGRRWRR